MITAEDELTDKNYRICGRYYQAKAVLTQPQKRSEPASHFFSCLWSQLELLVLSSSQKLGLSGGNAVLFHGGLWIRLPGVESLPPVHWLSIPGRLSDSSVYWSNVCVGRISGLGGLHPSVLRIECHSGWQCRAQGPVHPECSGNFH